MGSIHEKNQGPKISCYCTFNAEERCICQFYKEFKLVTYNKYGRWFCEDSLEGQSEVEEDEKYGDDDAEQFKGLPNFGSPIL